MLIKTFLSNGSAEKHYFYYSLVLFIFVLTFYNTLLN